MGGLASERDQRIPKAANVVVGGGVVLQVMKARRASDSREFLAVKLSTEREQMRIVTLAKANVYSKRRRWAAATARRIILRRAVAGRLAM